MQDKVISPEVGQATSLSSVNGSGTSHPFALGGKTCISQQLADILPFAKGQVKKIILLAKFEELPLHVFSGHVRQKASWMILFVLITLQRSL